MNTTADRRRHPRHIALFSAKYTVKSGTYRDFVRNVSAGGIYIISRQTIKDGQRISLRFPVLAFDKKPSVTVTVEMGIPIGTIQHILEHPIWGTRTEKQPNITCI